MWCDLVKEKSKKIIMIVQINYIVSVNEYKGKSK